MQQQGIYNQYPYPNQQPGFAQMPKQGPNAVNINIIAPQAYADAPCENFQPMYGANPNPGLPLYPMNYNNPVRNFEKQAPGTALGQHNDSELKTAKENTQSADKDKKTDDNKDKKTKEITPLTDEYVKSLENYLNNDNPKIRLIGAKELLERFKEDENRKDNPSLIPLLNKLLKDTSPSVRFLGLTTLQAGYSVGNDETVALLKQIQAQNQDKLSEDYLLASEILLKLSAPEKIEVEGQNEPEKTGSEANAEENTQETSDSQGTSEQNALGQNNSSAIEQNNPETNPQGGN